MPILYLMLGYPGAGKTTVSKIIHEQTGAVHLWADQERRERYGNPTYSSQENQQLYEQMNQETAELLAAGRSVIFDTNFNYYKDRQHLRKIASQAGARTVLVWVNAPLELARSRATQEAHKQASRVLGDMTPEHFDLLASKIEKPRLGETFTEIDGTKVTPQYVSKVLGI